MMLKDRIIELRHEGMSQYAIADRLCISRDHVQQCLSRAGLTETTEETRARMQRAEERRAEAHRLRAEGLTYAQIAERTGYARGTLPMIFREQPETDEPDTLPWPERRGLKWFLEAGVRAGGVR